MTVGVQRLLQFLLAALCGWGVILPCAQATTAHGSIAAPASRRALYLNPNTGRFWSMDSYEGNSSDPASLHKYLYCQASPIDLDDPTGNYSSWEQFMGFEAQDAIADNYIDTHPWINPEKILTGKRIYVKSRKYRYIMPDIVNLQTKQWLEIKPLSPTGMAAATLQYGVYYTLLKPLNMFPDATWVPTPILTTETGEQIYVANCGGVVFYVEKDQIVDGTGFLAGIAAGMTAQQLYGFVVRLTVTEAVAASGGLAIAGKTFDQARLMQTVGCAAMLSVLAGGVL